MSKYGRVVEYRCSIVSYTAGGAVVAGPKHYPCVARIDGGDLVLVEIPQFTLDWAPISTIEIDTPAFQRWLGGATLLQMNGNRWAIDFGRVTFEELRDSGRPLDRFRAAAGLAIPRAREFNRSFVTALFEAGASDGRRGYV